MNAPNDLLNQFAQNVFSQTGEDGIIEHILETIGDMDGWCVEFGAWDGLHYSNCANLLRNHGYSGFLIEADSVRFVQLQANYRDRPGVTTLNECVGFGASDNLDSLLASSNIPQNFDILSIDIDGNDYHVWESISRFRPKVVCIEFNPTIPNQVDFVQPANPNLRQGSSLRALDRLGTAKGYELVCVTNWNALFVEATYFERFNMADNSIDRLRLDHSRVTYLFSGYDGTVLLSGARGLLWHGLPITDRRVQQLPRFLRRYPDDYSMWQSFLFRWYSRLRGI